MSTTTIRLPEGLKKRIAAVAKNAGTTPHNFIVSALAAKTTEAELRNSFQEEADGRYAEFLRSGETIPWSEMRKYLEDRLAGTPTPMPAARKPG